MAALRLFGDHGASVHDLWRDSGSHRILPSRFLERVEVEPTCFCRSLRLVDLRRLRFYRFDNSRAPFAHRPIHSDGKNPCPLDRGRLAALELDLSALAPSRVILIAELRFKPASSELLNARHCLRGKSPSRRLPIRTRTSRFTS